MSASKMKAVSLCLSPRVVLGSTQMASLGDLKEYSTMSPKSFRHRAVKERNSICWSHCQNQSETWRAISSCATAPSNPLTPLRWPQYWPPGFSIKLLNLVILLTDSVLSGPGSKTLMWCNHCHEKANALSKILVKKAYKDLQNVAGVVKTVCLVINVLTHKGNQACGHKMLFHFPRVLYINHTEDSKQDNAFFFSSLGRSWWAKRFLLLALTIIVRRWRLQLIFSLNEQWVNMFLSFSTRSHWDVLPSNHKKFSKLYLTTVLTQRGL